MLLCFIKRNPFKMTNTHSFGWHGRPLSSSTDWVDWMHLDWKTNRSSGRGLMIMGSVPLGGLLCSWWLLAEGHLSLWSCRSPSDHVDRCLAPTLVAPIKSSYFLKFSVNVTLNFDIPPFECFHFFMITYDRSMCLLLYHAVLFCSCFIDVIKIYW